ncbi:glycosyltransferase family 1 protein [Sphingomonas naphthae]|uniref:Glycosyltransferase family 1 protein n=1 Tax=Sphingomonas naphthae TaxID=1813468 RepID=A0ABY7TQD9_9SPHN|nr:glycosyltransferase family 1 protein [Sphingomonas naphthae]WCT74847.1 glycosyltransferase family 1 protein [Sphingomonas naphthae]
MKLQHEQNTPSAGIDDAMAEAIRSVEALVGPDGSVIDRSAIDRLRQSLLDLRDGGDSGPAAEADTGLRLVFDVSDLLGYFPHNRAPTGIQRVQMEVIMALLAQPQGGNIRICRFLDARGYWVEVPASLFLAICDASLAGGDAGAADWRETYRRIDSAGQSAGVMEFGPNSVLINLGSSWWIKDYFLQIRELKLAHGVRYVPLIYDVIPARAPQYCATELVAEFIPWLVDVIDNADYFLAISHASKKDLIDFAGEIGRTIDDNMVGVAQLDADYRQDRKAGSGVRTSFAPIGRPYVLLVSTWEVRKNQIAALNAWRQLINQYGTEKVPQLVLVGKQGYKGNEVIERAHSDETLATRVTLLQQLSDEELASLYDGCLFVLYPSSYEGWGLPVTEALCYGKVPLTANNSSLPEAGGDFAFFFNDGSPSDLLASLKSLIFDRSKVAAREAKIVADFRPRTWTAIANEIRDHVQTWSDRGAAPDWNPPEAVVGEYYPMARRFTETYWPGMGTAEGFRRSLNWWPPEIWGCWSRPAGGRLAMRVDPARSLELALAIKSPSDQETTVSVETAEGELLVRCKLGAFVDRWIFVPIPADTELLDITISSDRAASPNGDHRKLAVGVAGFMVLDAARPQDRRELIEAVALGSLEDRNAYRQKA